MRFLIRTFTVGMLLVSREVSAEPMVFIPFSYGEEWKCSQGPGGDYSHTDELANAYDFNLQARRDEGRPILSPVAGTVVRMVKNRDNVCGSGTGWGNYVIIQDSSHGKFVRIAHMVVNSIVVNVGDIVQVGTYLGNVGCTGKSTGPHLHIQVQDVADTSVSRPMKFVEGPITCNDSALHRSQLLPFASLIDDGSETNIGNRFMSWSTSYYGFLGDWSASSAIPGYLGWGYYHHQVQNIDIAYFSWDFKVVYTGWYRVYANWTVHPNRDPSTIYELYNGSTRISGVSVNQTMGDSTGKANFKQVLGLVYLSAGLNYSVRVRGTTSGRYVIADAILLSRDW